jgi:pyridoxamine 5'-phosphate oxidase
MSGATDIRDKAMVELRALLKEATRRGLKEADCAALATAGRDSRPSVRTIYVAAIEDAGIVFFANALSGKARQLGENPYAGLCFFWPSLKKQVVFDGEAEMLSETDSDSYWRLRPRSAQLGAWVSDQAQPPQTSGKLKESLARYKKEFSFEQAPRPAHWRAWRVSPYRIEFWDTGWRRLISRIRYQKDATGAWTELKENP